MVLDGEVAQSGGEEGEAARENRRGGARRRQRVTPDGERAGMRGGMRKAPAELRGVSIGRAAMGLTTWSPHAPLSRWGRGAGRGGAGGAWGWA